MATLQAHMTDLALQLLREREQHMEQRLLTLEAEATSRNHSLMLFSDASPAARYQSVLPALVCHPSEKRNRLIPLIGYGARGQYVLLRPEEGALSIIADSPEWFALLASLSLFRFASQAGCLSARRGDNQRPNRCCYARRGIHQKKDRTSIGVSEHIPFACLEHVAAHFQAYLKERKNKSERFCSLPSR
jgi:hypothetical protein